MCGRINARVSPLFRMELIFMDMGRTVGRAGLGDGLELGFILQISSTMGQTLIKWQPLVCEIIVFKKMVLICSIKMCFYTSNIRESHENQ